MYVISFNMPFSCFKPLNILKWRYAPTTSSISHILEKMVATTGSKTGWWYKSISSRTNPVTFPGAAVFFGKIPSEELLNGWYKLSLVNFMLKKSSKMFWMFNQMLSRYDKPCAKSYVVMNEYQNSEWENTML